MAPEAIKAVPSDMVVLVRRMADMVPAKSDAVPSVISVLCTRTAAVRDPKNKDAKPSVKVLTDIMPELVILPATTAPDVEKEPPRSKEVPSDRVSAVTREAPLKVPVVSKAVPSERTCVVTRNMPDRLPLRRLPNPSVTVNA